MTKATPSPKTNGFRIVEFNCLTNTPLNRKRFFVFMIVYIRLTQQSGKLEFVGRADSQVVTNVVCFRSLPFNLGMIATGNH